MKILYPILPFRSFGLKLFFFVYTNRQCKKKIPMICRALLCVFRAVWPEGDWQHWEKRCNDVVGTHSLKIFISNRHILSDIRYFILAGKCIPDITILLIFSEIWQRRLFYTLYVCYKVRLLLETFVNSIVLSM